MQKRNRIALTLVCMFFGLFIFGFMMFGFAVPPVQAEEIAGTIVIGDDEEITGPYSAGTYAHGQAAQDYWKHRNYRMTVDGKVYKIKHLFVDNKCDVSLSVSNFHRFVSEGAVAVLTNWTPGASAMKPLAEKYKVPITCCSYNKKLYVPPSNYLYTISTTYSGILCAGMKWYKENVWKGTGKMKVGLLLWDTSMGRAAHVDSVYDYLREDLNVEVLPTQFFPLKVKDFTPQLLKFKQQGADIIFQLATPSQYAMLAKDAKRLNITPKMALMSGLWCLTDKYLELAKDAAEGTYGMWQWYVDPKDDNPSLPEVQKVHDAMEKYRGNRYYDINYFHGYERHYVLQHILEKTIKTYGFPITGEQVAETAANLEEWDWGLSRKFSGYSGGRRLGLNEIRMYQVQNNKVACVSDWIPEPAKYVAREPWISGDAK